MPSSPQSSPKAATTTATQLPWTSEDDAGWPDDSYDVDDEDILLGSLDEKEEDKNEDDPPIVLNSDDDDDDDGNGIVSPDESTRTTPAFNQIPPEPTPHHHPSSTSSAMNDVNNNDTDNGNNKNNAAPARNILSTISSPYTNTPMSQVRTPLSQVGTPLELYDGEDNFEETVRKRNRVSLFFSHNKMMHVTSLHILLYRYNMKMIKRERNSLIAIGLKTLATSVMIF